MQSYVFIIIIIITIIAVVLLIFDFYDSIRLDLIAIYIYKYIDNTYRELYLSIQIDRLIV